MPERKSFGGEVENSSVRKGTEVGRRVTGRRYERPGKSEGGSEEFVLGREAERKSRRKREGKEISSDLLPPAWKESVDIGMAPPASPSKSVNNDFFKKREEETERLQGASVSLEDFVRMKKEIDAFRAEIEKVKEKSSRQVEEEEKITGLASFLDQLLNIVVQARGPAREEERRGGQKEKRLTEDVMRENHRNWEDYRLKKKVLLGIQDKGYAWPSPIQEASLEYSLENRDIVARAKNGTGKAGAFIIPLLNKIDVKDPSLQALILIPTRELALQTSKICKELGKYLEIKILPLYGGVNTKDDIIRIKGGVQVLVGTPGRVLDFVEQRVISLSQCKHLICDEADKLLSREFKDVLYKLVRKFPQKRQIEMYSATFPAMVQEFISSFMNSPVKINLMKELALKGVRQYYAFVKKADKLHCLRTLLTNLDLNQCFIFCNSIINVERLAKRVTEIGFTSYFIHSKMKQEDRNMVFHNFTQGECRILVSTDLVTRGIDVPSVNVVINFDFPRSTESYLHRIGRSGRFGNEGLAINMVTEEDKERLEEIETELGVEILPFSSRLFH
jgi:ATP-dependent RNA helicase DDX6/DHH1